VVLDARKIATDTVLEILGFAYVDDCVIFVKIAIYTRLIWEARKYAFGVEI
jgi:hypothetical protein